MVHIRSLKKIIILRNCARERDMEIFRRDGVKRRKIDVIDLYFENIFTELSIEDPRGFRYMIRMAYEDFLFILQNFEEFLLDRAFLTAILV